MKRIRILTKGAPFREGSAREKCWSLLTKCKTVEEFNDRFRELDLRPVTSVSPGNYLNWAINEGHICLV